MSVLFIADPLERLDATIDTTVGLMQAGQERGELVHFAEALDLEIVDGRPLARARRIELAPSAPAGGCRWTVADPWFHAGPVEIVSLDEVDAVFFRTDPPMDETYVHATLVLDLVDTDRTAVINDPRGLRTCSEHLLPLQFPELIPPTVVSARADTLREFVEEHRRCVVKPIDGYAGHGVLILDSADPNLASLLELTTRAGSRTVLVQPYLSDVADGNKRIFLLDGEPQAAVFRYPQGDDFRIGEPSAAAPITARDRYICSQLTPTLGRNGLRMAGLDVIGSHLIEVNVTSPGALRKTDALLGTDLCAAAVDRALTHRDNRSQP